MMIVRSPQRGWEMVMPVEEPCRCAPAATMRPLSGMRQVWARLWIEPRPPSPKTS
jgi:hypothetical protein